MTQSTSQLAPKRFTIRTLGLLLLPLILLIGVIVLFLSTGGGLRLESPAPVENLTVENYVLKRNHVDLHIRNTGSNEI